MLRYWPNGRIDNDSASQTVLARFEDDAIQREEISTRLHGLIQNDQLARDIMDNDYPDPFGLDDAEHHCTPHVRGRLRHGFRQGARATCQAHIPGGASILA